MKDYLIKLIPYTVIELTGLLIDVFKKPNSEQLFAKWVISQIQNNNRIDLYDNI